MYVAFDIGGTFTDIVIAAPGAPMFTYKIASSLADIGERVARCIEDAVARSDGAPIDGLIHATTIASNAVVEGRGARTGFVTTKGFRDGLEIRRFIRPTISGYLWERTPPIVPRRRRLEVDERIAADGSVIVPLDETQVIEVARALRAQDVESVAVCLVNSYVNAAHERRVLDLLRAELPGVTVVASFEVLPEVREYERASTTALTAFLEPVVRDYLEKLEKETARYERPLFIMQANGGVAPSEHVKRFPASIIESGPTAGVLASSLLADELGLDHVVSFDMGGTTVKTCLIEHGRAGQRSDMEVGGEGLLPGSGYALRFPGMDLVEIGAGGGSIAWIDPGGALRTGPRSAGAVPGPVCYGRGGDRPTITDANVILGYINPRAIAGGTVAIDRDAAIRSFDAELCPHLGLPPIEAAYGVHQVANATMIRALPHGDDRAGRGSARVHPRRVRRCGRDPRGEPRGRPRHLPRPRPGPLRALQRARAAARPTEVRLRAERPGPVAATSASRPCSRHAAA